jgi:hypothetical protein
MLLGKGDEVEKDAQRGALDQSAQQFTLAEATFVSQVEDHTLPAAAILAEQLQSGREDRSVAIFVP